MHRRFLNFSFILMFLCMEYRISSHFHGKKVSQLSKSLKYSSLSRPLGSAVNNTKVSFHFPNSRHLFPATMFLLSSWSNLTDRGFGVWPTLGLSFLRTFQVGNGNRVKGFPGGSTVEDPPANAGDKGLIPDPGRSHMLQSTLSLCATLLSLCSWAQDTP